MHFLLKEKQCSKQFLLLYKNHRLIRALGRSIFDLQLFYKLGSKIPKALYADIHDMIQAQGRNKFLLTYWQHLNSLEQNEYLRKR